jgi:hypothetical protein
MSFFYNDVSFIEMDYNNDSKCRLLLQVLVN